MRTPNPALGKGIYINPNLLLQRDDRQGEGVDACVDTYALSGRRLG
jgi:hypothetical protein